MEQLKETKELAAGEFGWWPVLLPTVDDIAVGDRVTLIVDGEPDDVQIVTGVFEAKAWPLRRGLVSDAGEWTLGRMFDCIAGQTLRVDRLGRQAVLGGRVR
jgi:hypothetical protein